MRLRPTIAGAFSALLITGCAGTGGVETAPYERVLFDGYECSYSKALTFGAFSSRFKVRENGELFEGYGLAWNYEPPYEPLEPLETAGAYRAFRPRFTASWYRDKSGAISPDAGLISISRMLFPTDPEVARKPFPLRLGLRVAPDAPAFGEAGFNSLRVGQSGSLGLTANWLEFRALLRGSDHLYLVAIKGQREIVDRYKLNRDMFVELADTLPAAIEELSAMRENFRKQCEYTEDLEGDTIIVT